MGGKSGVKLLRAGLLLLTNENSTLVPAAYNLPARFRRHHNTNTTKASLYHVMGGLNGAR